MKSQTYLQERAEALELESMTAGEFTSHQIDRMRWIEGEQHKDRAWLLTDYDSWVSNPYYDGPPVRHPEAPEEDEL